MKNPASNFTNLIKKELVTRFESVVKNEINDYKNSQIHTQKEIDSCKDEITLLKDEIRQLKSLLIDSESKISEGFVKEKNSLKLEFEDQRRYIKTNNTEMKSQINELSKCVDKFVSRDEYNSHLSDIDEDLIHLKKIIHQIFTELEIHIDSSKKDIQISFEGQFNHLIRSMNDYSKVIEEFSKKSDEYIISHAGVIKELESYKKHAFIASKHIEDLYIQLERLKKVG